MEQLRIVDTQTVKRENLCDLLAAQMFYFRHRRDILDSKLMVKAMQNNFYSVYIHSYAQINKKRSCALF